MSDIQNVRVGIGCFVWKDGTFMMLQRQGSHGEGTWSLPGGHLEHGESWIECAAREVLEETDVHITNAQLLAVTNDIFIEESKHYVTLWITSDWLSGEPQNMEPEKCRAIDWRDFHSLPKPLFEPCWQNLRLAKPELFA